LSFKFPTAFKEKINADKAGTTWTGTADGVNYSVIVIEPKNALITDDSRTQAMNSMMATVGQGRKPKLEKAFNFQGLSAQEYTLSDAAGLPSKAIACVSAGHQYLFMAGGQNFKASKLPPEFFDGIRIGKIK
jgi:polygalacturonase